MPTPPSLILPGSSVPSNLSVPPGARVAAVESDVLDICARIAEIDPDCRIVVMHAGAKAKFALVQRAADNQEYLVLRADELDQRIVEQLQYIMRWPVKERLARIQKEIDAELAARERDESEALYDQLGGFFYDGLHRYGFTGTPNPRSVTPLGKTARRHGRKIVEAPTDV